MRQILDVMSEVDTTEIETDIGGIDENDIARNIIRQRFNAFFGSDASNRFDLHSILNVQFRKRFRDVWEPQRQLICDYQEAGPSGLQQRPDNNTMSVFPEKLANDTEADIPQPKKHIK